MIRGLAVALLAMGAIFIIQGFGLAATGSFMDRQPVWGYAGVALAAAGIAMVIFDRGGKG